MVLKITNLHILRHLPTCWLYLLERYTVDNQRCTHTVQLAFNGIAGPNGLGGITVQGTPSQITTNTDKHGNITYSFYVNGIALTAQVVVNLSAGSNYANATVYPMMNGNNLTFSGTLVPTSQSGIFRSGFISY